MHYFSSYKVSRVAAAFNVSPPIFLIKDFDNTVIFSHEGTGRFNPSSVHGGRTYEVCGLSPASTTKPQGCSTGPYTPFGSYLAPNFRAPSVPPYAPPYVPPASYKPLGHPPPSSSRYKRALLKKAILLESLSVRNKVRPS